MKTCFGKARGSRVFLCVFLCGFRGAFPAGGRAEHTRLACRFEAPAAIRVRGARLPLPCPRSGFEALSLPLALFRLVSLYYTRSRYTSILTFYTLQRVEAPPLRPPWSRRPPLPGSRAWSASRSRPLPLPFRVRGRWRFEAAGGSRGAGLPLVCVVLPLPLGLPVRGARPAAVRFEAPTPFRVRGRWRFEGRGLASGLRLAPLPPRRYDHDAGGVAALTAPGLGPLGPRGRSVPRNAGLFALASRMALALALARHRAPLPVLHMARQVARWGGGSRRGRGRCRDSRRLREGAGRGCFTRRA